MTRDILDEFEQQRRGPAYPSVPATPGLVVEDRASGFCGDVVDVDARAVTLRDRKGNRREFVLQGRRLPASRASRSRWSGRR